MRILPYILLGGALLLSACSRTEREKEFLNPKSDVPVREAFNVRFVFSEEAVIKATLEAPHAVERVYRSIDDNGKEVEENVQEFDRGVTMTFFDEEGVLKSTLTADSAWFPSDFKRAEFVGKPVRIDNEGGQIMEALRLFWDKDNEIIWAPRNRYPPTRIIQVDRRQLQGNRPDAVKRVFDKNYADLPDTTVVRQIRHLADSIRGLPEASPGDRVLFTYLGSVLDTLFMPPTLNRVHIETATENIYADSLRAKMDFKEYILDNPRGSIELEEGF